MTTRKLTALGCLCAVSVTISLKADEWNKKTVFTFSAPVEIPGQVLTPGTYVFKLLDTASDRHIVQVFNKDQNHLYATFLTIPDYRMKPPEKPLITFEERPAGSPEAIKAWFYPNDNYGNEFVYPKARAAQPAKDSGQNVPSMPSSMASGNFAARASANPVKFASLPPDVNVPLNSPGQPTRSPIQRMVSCSIFDANCERFTVANCGLSAATSVSANTPI